MHAPTSLTHHGSDSDDVILWTLSSDTRLVLKRAGNDLTEVVLHSTLCDNEGFLYLEIPDEIVDGFFQLIPERGLDKPSAASKEDYVGAHISVMYSEETERLAKKKKRVREVGESFSYTLDKMYVTEPEGWDEVKEVYFITVQSPELEALRKKYGLSKKLNGHDFHLTCAVRKRK
jgi:hypothetical protein